MKYFYPFIILSICLVACQRHSAYWDTLIQVESFIEERPDSALTVLQQINISDLLNKGEKAKHAVLLSMALDKNLIDKTDFELLQPAITYYKKTGSPTDKLRTFYYQGRIFQNMHDDASAMECFAKALTEGFESSDILTKARTYFAQSKIYYSLYDWEAFIKSNQEAAHLFKEAGKSNSYANCLIRIINGYTLSDDSASARPYLEECKRLMNTFSLNRLCDFYACYLTYLVHYGSDDDIIQLINEYCGTIPLTKVDWLSISNAYAKIGKYDDALRAISKCDIPDKEKNIKYQAIISDIYKNTGQYKESLEAYENYISLTDSVDYAVIQQDTKFVEERYQLELKTLKAREAKNRTYLWATISIFVLLALVIWIRIRLKINKIEKSLAEQEAEKYRIMYQQMEEEKNNLTNLLSKIDELVPEAKVAVVKRLDLLNRFFTAHITNNSEIDRKANKEMEELLANKDAFMSSTKLAFEGSHPKFVKYLEAQRLTEWEIHYCCLYALGLTGKEIGSYIKMRSHYNISSNIRVKLGISEHDTNLAIYIRQLLNRFE